jgi:purine-nucleoside phosphorylase
VGDIVVIKDHINFAPEHPLRGKTMNVWPRFVNMSALFSKNDIKSQELAVELDIYIQDGVYFGYKDLLLETFSEYKMVKFLVQTV